MCACCDVCVQCTSGVCVCVCECVYVMLSPVVSSTAKIYYEGSKLPVASLSLSLSLSYLSSLCKIYVCQ